jgi:preprotein translocase subunit SecE
MCIRGPGRGFKFGEIHYNYPMDSFTQYLRDTRAELRHVSWPTQQQTIAFTAVVIALSIATAAYLGVLDVAFARALEYIINYVN